MFLSFWPLRVSRRALGATCASLHLTEYESRVDYGSTPAHRDIVPDGRSGSPGACLTGESRGVAADERSDLADLVVCDGSLSACSSRINIVGSEFGERVRSGGPETFGKTMRAEGLASCMIMPCESMTRS